MTLAWTGKASDEEAYFSFHVLRELQNGVNPCPGIWVVLEVCEDFLSNSLLQNRQDLIKKDNLIYILPDPTRSTQTQSKTNESGKK